MFLKIFDVIIKNKSINIKIISCVILSIFQLREHNIQFSSYHKLNFQYLNILQTKFSIFQLLENININIYLLTNKIVNNITSYKPIFQYWSNS